MFFKTADALVTYSHTVHHEMLLTNNSDQLNSLIDEHWI